jgi:hypothetical protein
MSLRASFTSKQSQHRSNLDIGVPQRIKGGFLCGLFKSFRKLLMKNGPLSSFMVALSSFATSVMLMAPALSALGADVLTPIDLRQVKVGGEIGRRIDITVRNNLLAIDLDHDFLAPFQKRTAQEPDGSTGLVGMVIDSAVRLAAYTGDERVVAVKNHLVEGIIKTQEPDGYVGMFDSSNRMWRMWDLHEMGYIIYGLVSDYQFCGEQRSLNAARKAADYIIQQWPTMPLDWPQQTHVAIHVAVTGLDRTMLALSVASGDWRYRDFVIKERRLSDWNQGIVIGRRDQIAGHVYGFMAECLAQLDLYRLQPSESLLAPTDRAMRFLTDQDGMAITGGVGQWEIWTDDQDGRGELGETCATAYQLRVYESLLRLRGDGCYGDLIERTIYNALFGAQSPDGRQIRYFTPFEGRREYYFHDNMCCPNNYRRIMAELPTMIYYRTGNGLAINLYSDSQATIALTNGLSLAVRQETDYPSSGRVVIHLDPSQPVAFPLKLRIPRWCHQAHVAINGLSDQTSPAGGGFLTIEREWKAGDQVKLDMPMDWRLVLGRKRQSGRVAVMRGPIVFCLNPQQNVSLAKADGAGLNRSNVVQFNNGWVNDLAKADGADLNSLVIISGSLEPPITCNTVRPGGVACRLQASDEDWSTGEKGNLVLTLTEFADPEGKDIYFRIPDLSIAVPDELVGLKNEQSNR